MLTDLSLGKSAFTRQYLRQSARNFTGTELDKESNGLLALVGYFLRMLTVSFRGMV